MQTAYWRDLWDYLEIRQRSFEDVGLSPADTDRHVWQVCQSQGIYLLTNNRNDDGPGSLTAAIRDGNTDDSLPVFTISDADQVFPSQNYADRVVESLFDHLLRIDTLRGTGRLFLP
jgi:hypothetical protein